MKKFQNRYRGTTTRLANWDYGWDASYFVTLCTAKRHCFFGKIRNGEMELSEIGEIANKCWIEIPNHFPFVKLDSFVVMPNHVHGIIIIDKINYGNLVGTQNFAYRPDTKKISNLNQNNNMHRLNKFGPQSQNLASIIRGYKTGVTINARIIDAGFGWQPRYFDHIIRNKKSFNRIQKYIINNPGNYLKRSSN